MVLLPIAVVFILAATAYCTKEGFIISSSQTQIGVVVDQPCIDGNIVPLASESLGNSHAERRTAARVIGHEPEPHIASGPKRVKLVVLALLFELLTRLKVVAGIRIFIDENDVAAHVTPTVGVVGIVTGTWTWKTGGSRFESDEDFTAPALLVDAAVFIAVKAAADESEDTP